MYLKCESSLIDRTQKLVAFSVEPWAWLDYALMD
jgi:hypothetical protein